MKMRSFLFLFIPILFSATSSFAARSVTHQIVNPTANGSNFSFNIYSLSTGSTGVNVGLTSYYFTVSQSGFNFASTPVLSSVNLKYSNNVGDVNGDNNDYGVMSTAWIAIGPVTELEVTIDYTGNGPGSGSALSTTANGDMICSVTVQIADASQSSQLAWDQTNSAMVTTNFTNVTSIYQANISNILLPVELTSFIALAQGRTVNLSWATKTEINNSGFDVERQAVSTNPAVAATATWAKVGNVTGKGTTNTQQNYSFSDVVKEAGSYNYRLKQIDRSGNFTYSSEVAVKATLSPEDYKLSQNYPNPFNPSTKFDFAMKTSEHVAVKVYNSIGQEVVTLFDGVVPADQIQQVTFDGSRLASGIYFYILRSADRVEVKKMLLMK